MGKRIQLWASACSWQSRDHRSGRDYSLCARPRIPRRAFTFVRTAPCSLTLLICSHAHAATRPRLVCIALIELCARGLDLPPQREIGVSWYLFSNHCTCKCIHKRVITNKGVVPLWCSQASCRLPPHGVPMLRMLIALTPHPSVLRGWEFAQNTSPHTASPHPRRRASILTLFKIYGPGVLVNVCSPAVLGSAFLSRTLLGDSRFYGPARR